MFVFVRHCVITFVTLVLLVINVGAQKPSLPYLYFEVWNDNGKVRPDQSGFITVPNNERIRLRVYMKVKSVEDRFETLQIRALNQHPDYWKHRSPPNVTIQVKQVTANKTEVPFRILSSGGGKHLTVYDVDATLEILEAKEIREKRIHEFLTWMLEYVAKEHPGGLPHFMADKDAFVKRSLPFYEEKYINNPVGIYEITARYAPSTAENWRGILRTKPLKLRVIHKADPFDFMKPKNGKEIPARQPASSGIRWLQPFQPGSVLVAKQAYTKL
ncbi:MAG TPA: hypothetical protein VIT88_02945 [Pyrinomonadaceae bacterium]